MLSNGSTAMAGRSECGEDRCEGLRPSSVGASLGGVRHDAAAPDRRDEIVFCDNAIAVLHDVDQQVEYLRLHCNGFGAAAQLAPFDIKRMVGKDELHVAAPTGLPGHLQYRSRNRQNGDVRAVPGCDAGLVHGAIAERKAHSRRKNSGYLQKKSMPSAVRLQARLPIRA